MKDLIIQQYEFNLAFAELLLKDVADEAMADLAIPSAGHPAWLMGHLALTSDFGGTMIDLEPVLDPSWGESFAPGTTAEPDRSRYPSKAALWDAYATAHARVAEAFADTTDEQLEAPAPERLRGRFPTVRRALLFMMTSHEMFHLGQLSYWRRAAGLPSAM